MLKPIAFSLGLLMTVLGLTPLVQAQSQPFPFNNINRQSFFETGRLLSEDTLWFRSPPRDIMPVQTESSGWQLVVLQDAGMSFWLPPGVIRRETITLDTAAGPLNFQTMDSSSKDRRYVAAHAPNLTPEQIKNPSILLDALKAKVAPADQFSLSSDRPVTLDNNPGRELTFRGAEESIIFRAYLVKNQVYVMGVRYSNGSPQDRATRAFLSALELTK